MMSTEINKTRSRTDLSHVDTLADLLKEKQIVKARIKLHEEELAKQWHKFPAESFKFAVRKIVPFYLNNKILDKSWSIVSSVTGLLSKTGKADAKKEMLGSAKKLGVFTAIRALYNYWRKKK